MKKITLLLIFMATVMLAEMPEIAPQRMITDYNGIAYNDDIILCYGNYGIITFSRDLGDTWHRVNIGDKHNIKKIEYFNGVFYGISDYSIIKSIDGLHWDIRNLSEYPDINEITFGDNELYILQGLTIYKYDYDYNFLSSIILDSNMYQDLILSKNNLFLLKNNEKIIRINTSTMDLDTLNIDIFKICNQSNSIYKIYLFEDEIFFTLSYKANINNNITYLLKELWNYDEHNDTIVKYYSNMQKVENFIIHRDTINIIRTKRINKNNGLTLFIPILERNININESIIISDTSNFGNSNLRMFGRNITPEFNYNDIKIINDSVYIVAGNNSFISISRNDGESFLTKSFYDSYSRTALSPFFTDRNNIFSYAIAEPNIYKSTNGGVTFLPQYYNHDMAVIASGGRSEGGAMIYHNNKGLVFYYKNYYKTNDFGDTYTIHEYPISKLSQVSFKSYVINNNEYVVNFSSRYTGNYTMIFDESLNLTDTIRNDSISVLNIFKKENGNLLALSFHRRGYEETDDSYKYNDIGYKMVESDDNGRTWNELQIDVPLQEIKSEKGMSNIYMSQYRYGDYILIPKYLDSSRTLYTFDMNTEKFDSLQLPNLLNRTSEIRNMFVFQNKLHYISNDYKLMWAENFNENNIKWDSLDLTQYFHKWDSYDTFDVAFNKDCILGAWTDSSQIYLIKGISRKAEGGITFYINPVKLFKEDIATSVEILPHTETRNYLYTYPPYPQPASTEVRSLVYWDTSLEMNTESVKIYNINGTEVSKEQDISFEQINAYSGNLIWNCTNVPDGVYLIQISHGDKTQTIKVMVRK